MPSTNGFGINQLGGESIESVDVSFDTESKLLIDAYGEFSEAKIYDITASFSVKGSGTPSVSIGGASGAPDLVSGKVIITSVKRTQTNEDFERFEYSGTAYLSAS